MTPDELRSLAAFEGDDPRVVKVARLHALAPHLARLCAEQHEAIQGYVVAASRAPGNRDQDEVNVASEHLVAALAKLSELKPHA